MKGTPIKDPVEGHWLKKMNRTGYCPITKVLKVVGGKRAIPILINLKTTKRFGELEKIIIDISEKMLIQNLHLLEDAKFIKRKSFCEKTLHVEYSLLKRGKKFLKIMPTLIEIGNDL